jgi:hypothetical protein
VDHRAGISSAQNAQPRTLEDVESLTIGIICSGVTAVGLLFTAFRARRHSRRWTLRMLGVSLLPFALWATGIGRLLWRLGDASADFFAALVFNPLIWAGFAALTLAVLLLLLSLIGRRTPARGERTTAAPKPAQRKAVTQQQSSDTGDIEGMDEIEEILRRRGIR